MTSQPSPLPVLTSWTGSASHRLKQLGAKPCTFLGHLARESDRRTPINDSMAMTSETALVCGRGSDLFGVG